VPLLAGLAALGVCGWLYKSEANHLEAELRYRESTRMNVFATFIRHDLRYVSADLRELAGGQAVREFLSTGDPALLGRAAAMALLFSRQHPAYDRIAYVDEVGMERFSVGQDGLAPAIRLSDRDGEPFFEHSRALAAGQVAVSAFVLDTAQGRVLEPAKSVLRFSTPVFDDVGRWRGVIVIQYLGASLLSEIAEISPVQFHRLRMLNAQGYWIKAADPSQEWGFMYPDRAGSTMARTDPGLWEQVSQHDEGQVLHSSGLFTWHHIVPRQIASFGTGDTVAEDPYWVLASEVTASEWTTTFSSLRQSYSITGLVLLTLVASTLQFRRSLQRDRDRMTLHFESLFESLPGPHVILTPTLEIVAASDAYLKVTSSRREAIIGQSLFQAFPRNPDGGKSENPVADAMRASIKRVLATGKAETMPVHKYEIRREDGRYEERSWRVSNSPLRGNHGHVEYIIHEVADVTPANGGDA
jgi:PAS domain-containing protein